MPGKRKSRADVQAMTEAERESYEARRQAAQAPKDAYLVYTLNGEGLEIHAATRDANEVLKMTSGQVDKKYQHFMIK